MSEYPVADDCRKVSFGVQVLGSGGPEIDDGRASTSYLVWIEGKSRLMVDLGGGAMFRFEESGGKFEDLNAIAFTHLHADHSADFIGLIKAGYFSKRVNDIPVFGPDGNHFLPSMTQFMNKLIGEHGAWPYLADFLIGKGNANSAFHYKAVTVQSSQKRIQQAFSNERFQLSFIPVHHGPLPAVAWRIDSGGKSITFSGDMSNEYQTLKNLAFESDLLVAHNAIPEEANGVARNLHMPPSEIGKIATAADVKKIVLSHRMRRTLGIENRTTQFIKQHYQGKIKFANDLDCYRVR